MVPREGKPAAITINPEAGDQPAATWERFWATVDQIRERNADKDPDEVLRDVTAVVEEVR